jgi:hypothetical protein
MAATEDGFKMAATQDGFVVVMAGGRRALRHARWQQRAADEARPAQTEAVGPAEVAAVRVPTHRRARKPPNAPLPPQDAVALAVRRVQELR